MSIDSNLFKENSLIVLNEDKTITKIPKKLHDKNHREVFFKLKEENPSALIYFPWEEIYHCDGYEFANYVASIGKVVIWPTCIDNPEYIMITLPEKPNNNQKLSIYNIFPLLKEFTISSYVTQFYSPYTLDFITKELTSLSNYEDALKEITNYLEESDRKEIPKIKI